MRYSCCPWTYFSQRGKPVDLVNLEFSCLSPKLSTTQYEQFWKDPTATPVMWLGLLFCMMCLATQFQLLMEEETREIYRSSQSSPQAPDLIRKYREKIVQCLILGNYTKSVPYTIETLLLYFAIELFQCKDSQVGTWILFGIIVRIAMCLGYHRDASHYPRISPFHAEMRRRAWAMIVQLDLATSSQIGLPRMIKEGQSDTAEPQNLLDDDFNENMKTLPAPRPDTDMTPMIYRIVKNRLSTIFGMISDLTTSTRSSPYTEVLRLDTMLHKAYLAIPAGLQLRPMTKSIIDNADVVARRIYLALIFHKAQCVLHRRYLVQARSDSQYAYSRDSCVEAALNILQLQTVLHQAIQVGGQLYRDRWKVSSLVNHDCLLAVTILCLELDHDTTMESISRLNRGAAVDWERRDKMTRALQESHKIWLSLKGSSREAHKAAEALEIMFQKVERANTARSPNSRNKSSGLAVSGSEGLEASTGELDIIRGVRFHAQVYSASIRTPNSHKANISSERLRRTRE